MSTYDVTNYKIRVILDPNKIHFCSNNLPIDVEGTVYSITCHDAKSQALLNKGQIMESLSNNNATSATIRWDNDHKVILSADYLIIRSSEIGFCQSIWGAEDIPINFDNRPYEELKPRTIPISKKSLFDYIVKNDNYSIKATDELYAKEYSISKTYPTYKINYDEADIDIEQKPKVKKQTTGFNGIETWSFSSNGDLVTGYDLPKYVEEWVNSAKSLNTINNTTAVESITNIENSSIDVGEKIGDFVEKNSF